MTLECPAWGHTAPPPTGVSVTNQVTDAGGLGRAVAAPDLWKGWN